MSSIVIATGRPSPSSRRRAVLGRPSPLQSQSISIALAPSLAVHRRGGAVVPSITIKSPSRRPSPFIAVHHRCDRSPSPSPLRSRCPLLYRHRGAAAPSIAVEEPSRRPLTSRRAVHHRQVDVYCCQSVHCFQVSVAPSIAVHRRPSSSCRPSPSTTHRC